MNNDNAVQQDNVGKPRPFDVVKCKPGDPVVKVSNGTVVKRGRFVAYVEDAGPEYQTLIKWDGCHVCSFFTADGRDVLSMDPEVFLPPLDPLDEIDPSPGNVAKLTRRQVGEGYRIPAHNEKPDIHAQVFGDGEWRGDSYPANGLPYCDRFTYRVPIAPAMVPLEQSDIVLGKTVVRAKGGVSRLLVVATCPKGLWPAGTTGNTIDWEALRDCYEISFDHGVTWQTAEKKGGQVR